MKMFKIKIISSKGTQDKKAKNTSNNMHFRDKANVEHIFWGGYSAAFRFIKVVVLGKIQQWSHL